MSEHKNWLRCPVWCCGQAASGGGRGGIRRFQSRKVRLKGWGGGTVPSCRKKKSQRLVWGGNRGAVNGGGVAGFTKSFVGGGCSQGEKGEKGKEQAKLLDHSKLLSIGGGKMGNQ